MATYRPPKTRLHREFLYLNHETILNSLSALEAGAVDEIIQKVIESREGGFEGTVGAGPAKASGGKKKAASIEEQLVKTRTWFSAFESWHRYLKSADALGTFDGWDLDVRNALQVGDTIMFPATLALSPVHLAFRTFLAFADSAGRPGSILSQKGAALAETKQVARQLTDLLGGRNERPHLPMYLRPAGIQEPRIVASLQEPFLIGSTEEIEGVYTVVGQVSALLRGSETISTIRLIRNVPPTQMEVDAIDQALTNLIEPASAMGVEVGADDINIPAPAVVLQPIAIYR